MKRILEILKLFIYKCSVVVRRRRKLVSASLWSVATLLIAVVLIFGNNDHSSSSDSDTPQRATRESKPRTSRRAAHHGVTNSMSDFEQCKNFDKEIESFMRRWELTGASFALMRNDSLLYAKGYGYANKEQEVKMEVGHIMRIASASKLITATAIMRLVEQKKLTLDSKVFGENGILNMEPFNTLADNRLKLITVEHLLRHTGGFKTPVEDPAFSNYSVAKALGRELPLELDDMVRYATMFRLRSMPGDRYDYSNLGYQILTKVVEVASGRDYESFVKRDVLAPAGCYDIQIGENFSNKRASNEVNYYEVKEAQLYDAFDGSGKQVLKSNGGNNVNLLSGAGGWVASSVEMLRLVASINGSGTKRDILSKESVDIMTHDSRKKPIGWATVNGNEWLRSGSMAGSCTLIKHQSNGYTWVFITNSSAWIGYKLSNYISTQITRSVSKVKEWPKQDLFES